MSQCHVACWNVDMDLVQRLWDTNLYSFVAYGVSENLGVAQFLLDFKKRTYTNALTKQMEALGSTEISIVTFGNDKFVMAGKALNSVHKIGKKDQYVGGEFGECNSTILDRAKDAHKDEEKRAKEDRAEETAKLAAAVKASLGGLDQKQDMLVQVQEKMAAGQEKMAAGQEKMVAGQDDIYRKLQEVTDELQAEKARSKKRRKLSEENDKKLRDELTTLATELKARQTHIERQDVRIDSQAEIIARLNTKVFNTINEKDVLLAEAVNEIRTLKDDIQILKNANQGLHRKLDMILAKLQ